MHRILIAAVGLLVASLTFAQARPEWIKAQKPFQIYGNTYYVGSYGLSSLLITSKEGHVLIDGALPQSAEQIAANIKALGFRIEDIKLILNSHVHFDHAGGIAELQKQSGAQVAASPSTAKVLASGEAANDDPQFGQLPKIASVANVKVIRDGEVLNVGNLKLTAHFTPGHTPGGTTWTWLSCEGKQCLNVVYADSLNPISAKGYRYTDPARKPNGVQQLESSFATLSKLPCDVLIVPHPELVGVFDKLAKKEQGDKQAFVDAHACKAYVDLFREKLKARVVEETR